jgi:anti-sigma regulatory factor (Ser/Thr protein kinase)
MEVTAVDFTTGVLHTAFPMGDPSRVGEARRHAAGLSDIAQLDETAEGRVALIVTELGNNLVRHAQEGMLLLAAGPQSGEVEVIAIDRGPGIPDVARSLGDGYSTFGTPGTGLGAVRRLAQQFDMHSVTGEGTVIVARVHMPQRQTRPMLRPIVCHGIALAAPGETVCGDAWGASLHAGGGTVVMADGLGHGPEAAVASSAAIEAFRAEPGAQPRELLERTHEALRRSRGAAVLMLHLDAGSGTIRSSGAGNVMARVVSGATDRAILAQHGTAGLQIRRPEESVTEWPVHALVVVHSDGLESRWPPVRLLPVLGRDPTLAAAILLRDHCRGRDDVTIVIARRQD